MTRKILFAATLLLSTTTASAETDAERDVFRKLDAYAVATNQLKTDLGSTSQRAMKVEHCYEAIAAARAANVPDSYEMYGHDFGGVKGAKKVNSGHTITFGQARQVCDNYKPWSLLKDAQAVMSDSLKILSRLEHVATEDMKPGWGAELATTAKACTEGLDRLIKEGVSTSYVIEASGLGTSVKTTVAKAKTEICEAIAAKGKTIDAEIKAAVEAKEERTMKPYRDAGLTGDRLAVIFGSGADEWYGVGQVQLGLADMKKPRVLFRLSEDGDRVVTIRRYQFKGDKLIKETSKQYFLRPGPKAFR